MAIYMMKYNPSGIAPSGATQLKTLAIATGTVNVGSGGWYGGVDDDGVYLITCDTTTLNFGGRSTGNHTGVAGDGLPTVWKTTDRTEASFLSLVNKLPGSPGNFTTSSDALVFLDTNNFGVQPTYVSSGNLDFEAYFLVTSTGKAYINGVDVLSYSGAGTYLNSTTINEGDTFYASIVTNPRNICVIEISSTTRGILYSDTASGPLTSETFTREAGEDITITLSAEAGP